MIEKEKNATVNILCEHTTLMLKNLNGCEDLGHNQKREVHLSSGRSKPTDKIHQAQVFWDLSIPHSSSQKIRCDNKWFQ